MLSVSAGAEQPVPTPTPAPAPVAVIPGPPALAASAYVMMDADSGRILAAQNENERMAPASLTKILTSYMVAEELQKGRIRETDEVNISIKAWQMGGSRMYVREGTKVPLLDLLRGVVIQSGNDASVALAEHISGSEETFAEEMNRIAAKIGMKSSHFVNATGWPSPDHYTTAYDLALLARALVKNHPEHYNLYSEKYFHYNNINQPNRNRLLWIDPSVDGIKTGHTEEAGYCLVASAKRDNMRLVTVVLGTSSDQARTTESQKLLTYGFRYFETHKLYNGGEALQRARVYAGAQNEVELGLAQDLHVTVPRGQYGSLAASLEIPGIIKAPLAAGQNLGKIVLKLGETPLLEQPLTVIKPVEEGGWFKRLLDAVRLFFLQLFGGDGAGKS